MVRLLADTHTGPRGSSIGVGVDQNTALATAGPGRYTVVGASGAWWFDVSNATVGRGAGGAWEISGVRASYATRGDTLEVATGRVGPAAWKQPLRGHEQRQQPITSHDVFNSP